MPLSPDTTANLLNRLKALQSAGEAIPAPAGGIVKCVAGVGITLIETAERVRVNKEECSDIARRAAEQILVLKSWLDHEEGLEEPLSDDLRERLERYLEVLTGVSTTVERLGNELGRKRIFKTASIQDETKDCLNRLNEAYQMYMFQFSLAADTKLTGILNRMQVMSLSANATLPANQDEPDEIRRIPTEDITFLEEISCRSKRGYTIRFGKARMIDWAGHKRAVIVKKFQTMDACEDRARNAFNSEIELRRDLLHPLFARMLGVSIASRRTKMIVIEAGLELTMTKDSIVAFEYFQSLPGLKYFLEHSRIWTCTQGLRKDGRQDINFFGNSGGPGEEGQAASDAFKQYQDVLLSARDKRLCLGGLGRMDSRWEDSGWRMNEAFWREEQLREGRDGNWGATRSFEFYADEFERMRKAVTRWNEEKTKENARDLLDWLRWWSDSSEFEYKTENSRSVGEIGWKEGKDWHLIPLLHQFPLAEPPEYFITASRSRDGERETIVGTRISGYTRWSIHVSPGEEIYLRTFIRSLRTEDIADFFLGSALSLAKVLGIDVHSLRLLSNTGFQVDAFLTVFEPSTVHYFAHPPTAGNCVPDPPGFWSLSPDPLCSDCHLRGDAAHVRYRINPYIRYDVINDRVLSLLQDLESHGFLTVPDITYASGPSFASIAEISEHATESAVVARGKKHRAKNLLSIFSRKRKVSNP
ncbi:hypothetical protein SISNIDRAFT_465564 [Sistotremastrum niveocremeum HHB9708]|uniref:Protein kinase domain-containing protein n=1 Tax=Sistotremastrum niveocremeum HHB9708 TaxID=1314777 RepID=A0A164VAM8_9AGAM|nr:hypothetical protein SISNIDRAFT_465564 [Sistotremastrum niveocremeum HHB9708]